MKLVSPDGGKDSACQMGPLRARRKGFWLSTEPAASEDIRIMTMIAMWACCEGGQKDSGCL